jgi:tetratricopeptide (TPR) repeat protein
MRDMKSNAQLGVALALLAFGFLYPLCIIGQSNGDFEHGLAEFRAGNYSSAAERFARAEGASPGTTSALLYQAKCLVHLDSFVGAEKALHTYLGSHPDSSDAAYLLGFVLHRENRPAESLAAYTKAAAITRPTGDDLKIVGLDYVLLDDYSDAIKWLQKAVEFDPQNKDAWYYLGRAYYSTARLPEARKSFLAVLSLDGHNARSENNLGLILETEGHLTEAAQAYRQSIAWQQQSAHPSEQPYVNLGSLLMEQGEIREAEAALQKAVELAPANAYCHLKLGMLYHKSGQLQSAQRELERATELEPDNATAHYQLGRVYKDENLIGRAQAEFARTEELQARSAKSRPEPANN